MQAGTTNSFPSRMEITVKAYTPEKLSLTMNASGCVYTFFACLLFAAGALPIWLMGDQTKVSIENGVLNYDRKFMAIWPRESFSAPASDLKELDVKLYKGVAPAYEVYALTRSGTEQKFPFPFSDGDEKSAIAEEMRNALNAEGASFSETQDAWISGFTLGGACWAGGLICLLVIQRVNITANRTTEILTLSKKKVLLPSGKALRISIPDISGTNITDFVVNGKTDSTGVTTVSYQVWIETKQGEKHPLAFGAMFTDKDAEYLANILDAWLAGRDQPAISG